MWMTPERLAFVTSLAVLVGLLMQAVKSNAVDRVLAAYNIPAIPKYWVPRLTLALAVASAICDALLSGETTAMGMLGRGLGTLAAATAPIVVHEVGTNRQAN